jgi:large repetitive protein
LFINALTSSLECSAHPGWRGTARFEWRGTSNSQSFLNTLGAVVKMSTNWSMLGRNVFNVVNSTSGSTNDQLRNRSQLGFAYRDTATSVWNVLAMVEFRAERNASVTALTSRRFAVFSANLNYQPAPKLVLSSRYATKSTIDQSSGLNSSSGGDHLVAGRLTYDVGQKWDIGLQTSASFSNGLFVGLGSLQYGIGPEIGRMLAQNLWLSAGYNVFGFRNTDLAGESETNRGAFIRLRYKFDESVFKGKVAR